MKFDRYYSHTGKMERSGPYIWIYCQQHLIRTTLNVFTWGMGGGGGVHPLLHLWGKLYISLLKTSMSAPSVFLSCKRTLLWLKEINAYRHALTHQGTVKLYTHTHTLRQQRPEASCTHGLAPAALNHNWWPDTAPHKDFPDSRSYISSTTNH